MGNSLTRKRKNPGELREVLAQNINKLMEQRYAAISNRPMALAKETGVSLSSVQRTLSRETGATVDTVEAFAKVLIPGLPAFQLLVPWGMLGQMVVPAARPPTQARQPLFRGVTRGRSAKPHATERKRRTG